MEVSRSHGSKRKLDDTISTFNGFDNNKKIDLSLLEAIEKSHNTVEVVDLRTLKKLVLSFERRLKENIEARLKYPNQPNRFADSELELHEELHKLKVLAGAPELYPDLVNLNVVPSIVDLLNHDNTDIAIDVTQLLQDLTDEDVLDDNDEPARILVDALVDNSVLVQNLHRLSESDPDENAAIYNTLATIENLIEVKPAVAELVCEKTKLLKWFLGKIKVRINNGRRRRETDPVSVLVKRIRGLFAGCHVFCRGPRVGVAWQPSQQKLTPLA